MDFRSTQHTNSEQITAYLNGEMTDKEAVIFENHINQCEFCNDALEGIEMMPTVKISNTTKHVLKRKLQQKLISKKDVLVIQIWQMIGITAFILVITSISVFVLNQRFQNENKNSVFEVFKKFQFEVKEPIFKIQDSIKVNLDTQSEILENEEKKLSLNFNTIEDENSFDNTSKSNLRKNEIEIIKDLEFSVLRNLKNVGLNTIENPLKEIKNYDILFDNKKVISNKESDFLGTTYNQNKLKLPSVVIKLKGLNIGTISDENGNFNLKNLPLHQVMVFSSNGFKIKEMTIIELRKSLNVYLEKDTKILSGVIPKGKSEKELLNFQNIKPTMGWPELQNYIKQNVRYPEDARLNKANGKVILGMNINESGNVISYNYLQKLGYGCDEEALRVLKNVLWEPVMMDGKISNSSIKLSIKFGN